MDGALAPKEGTMFKHILIPTDGSNLSEAAIRKGMEFAKDIRARVTGMYAMPEFHVFTYRTEMLEDTKSQFEEDCMKHAQQYLSLIDQAAKAAGVQCDTVSVSTDHPYQEIIETANKRGCDLILMASHGRRGVQGMLLGSETQKVLTHSRIPVLVYR
jgi:nucleotide-binding universal stress UspA family protein